MITFVSVKQKIISIFLLLSFLIVLTHEMVPHHHHESREYDVSTLYKHSAENHHHAKEGHDHEKPHSHDGHESPEPEEHHQNFPLHFHSAASDDYARVSNSNPAFTNFNPLIVVLPGTISLNPDPPVKKLLKYWNFSIPFFSSFITGAIGLRAPPYFV
ncbi:hypothetical protein BY457_109146 [Marinilabilia salmonicolor]|uniref:hypothetical protein n=1 Tax=Marinilabilia salmonicolor TaxID=989 RepID=UPI000D06748C|nr:hypothetical protein [Marinilabilia salmonicolor]PRY98877.1 hypothetical protein BY457_109146 [Marinilabilia salmonicolor]